MVAGLYHGPDLSSGTDGDVANYTGISIREIRGQEGSDSVSGSGTASRTWLVKGSSNPITCRTALIDGPVLINEYDGLFIDSLSRERVGPDSWEFTATYNAATPDVGSYTISIDTTGGQILQTYSYNQTSFPATDETATDYHGAIDVQDGKPQGVPRIIPALKINFRARIASEYISSPIAYAKIIAGLTGSYNSGSMFGGEFAAGELLFAGATGDIVGQNPQLVFSFLASKNVTGLTIGDIVGINKLGHHYLWFSFAPDKDDTTKLNNLRPIAAYVDQVYGPADLSALSIGLAPS